MTIAEHDLKIIEKNVYYTFYVLYNEEIIDWVCNPENCFVVLVLVEHTLSHNQLFITSFRIMILRNLVKLNTNNFPICWKLE